MQFHGLRTKFINCMALALCLQPKKASIDLVSGLGSARDPHVGSCWSPSSPHLESCATPQPRQCPSAPGDAPRGLCLAEEEEAHGAPLKTGSKQRGAIHSFDSLMGIFRASSSPAWLSRHGATRSKSIPGFKAPFFGSPFSFSPTELFLLAMEGPLQLLT